MEKKKNDPNETNFENVHLSDSLEKNLEDLKKILGNTADLLINPITVGGVKTAVVCFEGMVSGFNISQSVILPIMEIPLSACKPHELWDYVNTRMILSVDSAQSFYFGDIIRRLMSGFAVYFIDGIAAARSMGIQGYATRGIDEPSSEGNVTGSHEGFVETVRTNMSLIRRRMKTPVMRFRLFPIASKSHTDVIVCYMSDRVPETLVKSICRRLQGLELETILGTGYVAPFLDSGAPSVFSGLSVTERPDVMCAKLLEGRVGVLIEGTPFALVLPALFAENFQTLDDYNYRPFYAVFLRYIRYFAFLIAIFLPGIYVGAALFDPEMFNSRLLLNLAAAEENAPLQLMWEALITLIFYEMIKEAGVRLPKSIGGAVSIVGGLIIGDAAVSAGIISNPVLLVCAISVTAAFVIPSLDQQLTVFRMASVIMGGLFGLFGIALLGAFLLANICAAENYGVAIMSPAAPFTGKAMGDVAVRLGFKKMGKRGFTVEKLNGANIGEAAGKKLYRDEAENEQ